MSGHFSAKYSDEQRDAIASAVLDRGAKYKRAVEMAAAGDLTTPEGEKLAPFKFSASYVGTVVDRAKKRRLGVKTTRAGLEPRDAVEALRRELVDVMDSELRHLRKVKAGSRDPEKLRQFARALRELQAIPGPKEEARPAPGQKVNGQRNGGATTGLGADLVAAMRSGGQGSTAPDAQTSDTQTENVGAAGNAPRADTQQQDEAEERRPGSSTRAIARAALSAA